MVAKLCFLTVKFVRLMALCCWLLLVEGRSVDLSLRGGDSLVGEICPGIVTLECDTVDTNQLRWRFNGNNNIIIYFADDSPSQDVPSQTAFPSVELTAISRSTVDPNRANYSTFLLADLSLLQADGVMEIECGDATAFQILPIDVEIIQRSPPRNPSIVMVTADYQSEGQLDSVTVEWRKSTNYCPDFGLNFTYQVNISSERSTMVEHDSTAESCVTEFTDIENESELPIQISILASNELGSSNLVSYMYAINRSAQSYFRPSVSYSNNQFIVKCVPTIAGIDGTDVCSVRYTTNSSYTGLSDPFTTTLDTPLVIPELNASVTYYFEFSLLINDSLMIVEQTAAESSTGSSEKSNATLIGSVIGVILFILLVLSVTLVVFSLILYTSYRRSVAALHIDSQMSKDVQDPQNSEDELFSDDCKKYPKELPQTRVIVVGGGPDIRESIKATDLRQDVRVAVEEQQFKENRKPAPKTI